jgi:hypothetical protein
MNTQDFTLRLREYLLVQMQPELALLPSLSREQRMSVLFKDNCLYEHATARVHFTTYDLRRDQDIINPSSDKNTIMIYLPDQPNNHPWAYARVLGIFHTTVRIGTGLDTKTPFLWVRYLETERAGSAAAKRLERVRYVRVAQDGPLAFGFVNPANVIRGVHLLPDFEHGFTYDYLNRQPSFTYDTKKGDRRFYEVGQ